MRNFSLACVAALALFTSPAPAHEQDIDEQIRAFLLENPEVILEALERLSAREEALRTAERMAQWPDLFASRSGLGLGAADAPIRVVEFFDYRCQPCKAVHPELKAQVAANPDLRIDMRHLPILSPGSERAARFALAVQAVAGDAIYGEVHEALWALRGPLNASQFKRLAADFGLEYEALDAIMQSDEISARITYNRDAAIALQILGTPAFVTPQSVSFGASDLEALVAGWLSQ